MSARRIPGQVAKDFSEVLERLTGRDMQIIDLLARHRIFTADQLADLCFPSRWAARIRLVTLAEMEVLARFRDDNRSAFRYALGIWGAAVHAWRRNETPPTKSAVTQAVHQLAVSQKRSHLEGVNSFFTTIAAEARADGGSVRLAEWRSEDEAASMFLGKVRPDGAMTLVGDSEAAGTYFFEYDTGSETLEILTAKLDRYASRQPVGGHRRVLVQLTRPRREANLHHRLARHTLPFVVATTTAVNGLFGDCWRPVGHAERVSLRMLGIRAVLS
ncbi:replication-relaxation family protein [Glycomyces sp. NPDC047369]